MGSDEPITANGNLDLNGIVAETQYNNDPSNVVRIDSFLGQPNSPPSLYFSKVENDFQALESQLKVFNETPRLNNQETALIRIREGKTTPETQIVDTRTSLPADAQSAFTLHDNSNNMAIRGSRIGGAGRSRFAKLSEEDATQTALPSEQLKQESQQA